jgi:hypothetical protein
VFYYLQGASVSSLEISKVSLLGLFGRSLLTFADRQLCSLTLSAGAYGQGI